MTSANENGPSPLATPPTTPPPHTKTDILTKVLSLATLFSTCVEAFNLIHPSKDGERAQKVALAKVGIQQGRLLIFGDAVGISSPPATIARHMIPSHPGATNPDPHLPVNFGVRDLRLDQPDINDKVRAALDEIAGRPSHLSREELMEKYGLKSPKRFSSLEYPALDTNRLEAFREKYGLLQDLVRQTGVKSGTKRAMSMTMQHWTVRDVEKFDAFVQTVRAEVDGLIALMGVKEHVDRGMKTDIRAMGWHPDLSGPVVRHDWEKLKLIREACADDYPEYIDVTDTALKYISDELKETTIAGLRAAYRPATPPTRRKSEDERKEKDSGRKIPTKDRRPSFFSSFKFKSWGKDKNKAQHRSKSLSSPSAEDQDPQRSLSEDISKSGTDENTLEPVRSKSLSALPDEPAPFNLDSRLVSIPSNTSTSDGGTIDLVDTNRLVHADTANSLVERHDMFKGVGRIETKDIRAKAHDWAS